MPARRKPAAAPPPTTMPKAAPRKTVATIRETTANQKRARLRNRNDFRASKPLFTARYSFRRPRLFGLGMHGRPELSSPERRGARQMGHGPSVARRHPHGRLAQGPVVGGLPRRR